MARWIGTTHQTDTSAISLARVTNAGQSARPFLGDANELPFADDALEPMSIGLLA